MGEIIMLRQRTIKRPTAEEQAPYVGIWQAPAYEDAKGAAVRGEAVTIWSDAREGLTFSQPTLTLRGRGHALTAYQTHPDETRWQALVVALDEHLQYTYPQTSRKVIIRHALILYGPCQLEPRFWTFDERLKFS